LLSMELRNLRKKTGKQMQKSVISNYNIFIRYPCFINLLPTILPLLDPAAIT